MQTDYLCGGGKLAVTDNEASASDRKLVSFERSVMAPGVYLAVVVIGYFLAKFFDEALNKSNAG